MWLINTTTLKIHEVLPGSIPPYGILSHRWEDVEQEVSFKDFRKGRRKDSSGYKKIETFCVLLQRHGIEWAWVDTCCIDKRSSAELSEAINSMYDYYASASTCYVYLKDASCASSEGKDWLRSDWWLRGWTLQELIAPSAVFFYDRDWTYIASKNSAHQAIAQRTRIPEAVLKGQCSPRAYTAAQRMSWASSRQTTRIEDMAYSMLGLFDINMPLLYGEGGKAFQRLQLEILQKDSDESVFAWNSLPLASGGLLAPAPAWFKDCVSIQPEGSTISDAPDETTHMYARRSPAKVTAWGIEIVANAAKLYAIGEEDRPVNGSDEHASADEPFYLYALTLTTSRRKVRPLPCTLILLPLDRLGRCERWTVLYGPPDVVWRTLSEKYRVQPQAEVQRYLGYDSEVHV